MDIEQKLAIIEAAVKKTCKSLREDAAYSGSWDDGGASRAEERFKAFNDGVTYEYADGTQHEKDAWNFQVRYMHTADQYV